MDRSRVPAMQSVRWRTAWRRGIQPVATDGDPRMVRRVVLLCGPPGAGKTTAALTSGLYVYDRDDEHWTSERQFTSALRDLAIKRDAQAVVIRSAASSSARTKAARLVRATETYLILGELRELERRIAHRRQGDVRREIAGLHAWFDRFDHHDGVPEFPGWELTQSDGAIVRQW